MRQAFMILASLAILPVSAAAAGDDPQGTKPPDAKPGVVVVEQVQNGFAVGPDVKYTRVSGHDGVLVGGFGGVLLDRTIFVGAAGYWLANGDWDRGLSYGGVLVEWHFFGRRTVAVSLGGLVGGGFGTAPYQWSKGEIPDSYPSPRYTHGHPGPYPPAYYGYTAYDAGFFVAEPQVSVVWRAAEWMSVSAGIGYRAVAGADSLNQEFRGATGSVAIRFGSSGK
jgi:hypothetical protein